MPVRGAGGASWALVRNAGQKKGERGEKTADPKGLGLEWGIRSSRYMYKRCGARVVVRFGDGSRALDVEGRNG